MSKEEMLGINSEEKTQNEGELVEQPQEVVNQTDEEIPLKELPDDEIEKMLEDGQTFEDLADTIEATVTHNIKGSKQDYTPAELAERVRSVATKLGEIDKASSESEAKKKLEELDKIVEKITNAKFSLRSKVETLLQKREDEKSLVKDWDIKDAIVGVDAHQGLQESKNALIAVISRIPEEIKMQTSAGPMSTAEVVDAINSVIKGGRRDWEDLKWKLTSNYGLRPKVSQIIFSKEADKEYSNDNEDSGIYDSLAG